MTAGVVVRMWEAKVLPGRLDDAVAYLTGHVVADALGTEGCLAAEMFRSLGEQERVVLVTRWEDGRGDSWEEGTPSEPLWERAHAWWFVPVT